MTKGILIVDDSLFMRTILRDILTEANYTVVGEASDGEEALEKFHSLNPDLVTLDVIIPGIMGLEVLKKILKDDPGANVIMISALGQERLVNEALEIGAKGYVVKPFKDEKVVEEVGKVLGSMRNVTTVS